MWGARRGGSESTARRRAGGYETITSTFCTGFPGTGARTGPGYHRLVIRGAVRLREPGEHAQQSSQQLGTMNNESSSAACSICLSSMSALPSSTPVLQLPRCQHIFCRVCLDQWWGCAPRKSCPACRTVYSGLRHLQREELTAGDLLAAASSKPNNNEDCALTKSDFAGGAQTAAVLGGSDDEEEFVVEAICGARTRKGAAQFEVKW